VHSHSFIRDDVDDAGADVGGGDGLSTDHGTR